MKNNYLISVWNCCFIEDISLLFLFFLFIFFFTFVLKSKSLKNKISRINLKIELN